MEERERERGKPVNGGLCRRSFESHICMHVEDMHEKNEEERERNVHT